MHTTTHYDYVIIGAGLTGLSLVAFLQAQGARVAIVEQANRPGGKLHTVTQAGYTFESGPNTGVVANDAVLALFDLLKGHTALVEANKASAIRYVLKDGRPVALPTRFWSAITTPLFSWRDKLNILIEPFRPRGKTTYESVGELVRRRLGQSFYDYAVDPFISGIYAGDPDTLIARYALPKLYRLEALHGSFIRGAWARRHILKAEKARGISKAIFSVAGGMGRLIEALVEVVGRETLTLGAKDVRLVQSGRQWQAHFIQNGQAQHITATRAISTVAAQALPSLLPQVESSLLTPITAMRYAPVVELGVGLADDSRVPRGFGLLVPSKARERVLGILFTSQCYAGRAPKGGASLSVFMGGMRQPEVTTLSDEALTAIALDAITRYFGYDTPPTPEVIHIARHTQAIPQYEADTPERLRAIGNIQLSYPNLYLAGSIADGIGIADRIQQAWRLAHFFYEQDSN
ncbi:MAG: protoporphyrinogen oxidase [Bacteroidales bacterium]|nr:protoporphyrinogen oxidase [Bacteroidales bacterium]